MLHIFLKLKVSSFQWGIICLCKLENKIVTDDLKPQVVPKICAIRE